MIAPVSSAIGMNTSAGITDRSARRHRASASRLNGRNDFRSTIGW